MAAALELQSTHDLAPRDRLPFWNELAQRIAPIQVEAVGDAPFQASIARRRFRDFELISPSSSPARIFSRPGHEGAGMLNIQVQHTGRSTNHTAGRTCQLEEGDFLVYDPSRPLWLDFDVPTQAIVLQLPLATVEERLPHLRGLAGIRMSGSRGPGALFSNMVRSTWMLIEAGDDDWAEALPDVIWPMLRLTFPEPAGNPEHDRRATLRRELFAAVDAELCDPDLDTHRIARRLGVSARYVQILFAEMATTPSAFIRGRRLELAARRLATPGAATITDVAYAVGFNDLSSFCRAFRQRFEVSARDYRAGGGRRLEQLDS